MSAHKPATDPCFFCRQPIAPGAEVEGLEGPGHRHCLAFVGNCGARCPDDSTWRCWLSRGHAGVHASINGDWNDRRPRSAELWQLLQEVSALCIRHPAAIDPIRALLADLARDFTFPHQRVLPAECGAELGHLSCELPAGHARSHQRGAVYWTTPIPKRAEKPAAALAERAAAGMVSEIAQACQVCPECGGEVREWSTGGAVCVEPSRSKSGVHGCGWHRMPDPADAPTAVSR